MRPRLAEDPSDGAQEQMMAGEIDQLLSAVRQLTIAVFLPRPPFVALGSRSTEEFLSLRVT